MRASLPAGSRQHDGAPDDNNDDHYYDNNDHDNNDHHDDSADHDEQYRHDREQYHFDRDHSQGHHDDASNNRDDDRCLEVTFNDGHYGAADGPDVGDIASYLRHEHGDKWCRDDSADGARCDLASRHCVCYYRAPRRRDHFAQCDNGADNGARGHGTRDDRCREDNADYWHRRRCHRGWRPGGADIVRRDCHQCRFGKRTHYRYPVR